MTLARKLLVPLASACAWIIVAATSAAAQSSIDPTTTPVKNTGGWVYGMAWLITILAAVIVLSMVVAYMRYAPRFAKDEEGARVVHADRVLPGREPPRRTVDLSQAVPIVVQPPAIPAAVAAGSSAAAPAAIAAPGTSQASGPAASAEAPAVTEPPAAETPSSTAAAAPPGASAAAAAETPSSTAAAAPGPSAPATPPPQAAAPPPAAERPEVSVDQEVYDKTLEELLAKGTDRRVAEGQAKRAGLLAARKKAAGEG